MAQYHVLTGLTGEAVALEDVIDNAGGKKCVGLREVTYVTGWHNISASLGNNTFKVRPSSAGAATTVTVPDGYYNVDTLKGVVAAAIPRFSANINHATGLVTLTLEDASYQLDLAKTAPVWGFNTPGWKGAGIYIGSSSPTFFSTRNIFINLDQLSSTGSVLNGRNSTLLRVVPTSDESFGETRTINFENPQFRRLRSGCIQELTVRVLDADGSDISTNTQPFSVTLEIRQS